MVVNASDRDSSTSPSKILTSEPARPPLAPLSIRDPLWEEECLDT